MFSKNAIHNPNLASVWLATWRDTDGIIHHDLLHTATTNNQAEYGSMLRILHHIRARVDKLPWLTEAVVWGDSQLVVNQMNGLYQVKEEQLKPLFAEAANLVIVLKQEFNITVRFRWIRRELNNQALKLRGRINEHDPNIEEGGQPNGQIDNAPPGPSD